MTTATIRNYKLAYVRGTGIPFWIALCPDHVAARGKKGATIMERRACVTLTDCADCMVAK